jgi:serine/threonine protein kinase
VGHKVFVFLIQTKDYIAPEVDSGKPYDNSCDLFSLGGIIYFILSNSNPFGIHFDFSKIKDKYETEYCEKMIYIIENLTCLNPKKRFSLSKIVEMLDGNLTPFQVEEKETTKIEISLKSLEIVTPSQDQIKEPELKSSVDGLDKNLEAVKKDNNFLKNAPMELKSNKEIVLEAIKSNPYSFNFASDELKEDKDFVLKAAKINYKIVEYASQNLIKNDKDVMLAMMKINKLAWKRASNELKNQKDFILEVVKLDGYELFSIPFELQQDKDVVLAAVSSNGLSVSYATYFLNDKDVILAAVKNNSQALKSASRKLLDDREFIFECAKVSKDSLMRSKFFHDEELCFSLVKESIENFNFISPILKSSEAFLWRCFKENFHVFNYFDLKTNEEFILEAVKINIGCLQYISDNLKNDETFAVKLVEINGNCLEYLSKELRNNIEIVKLAIETTEEAHQFASKEIQYSGTSKLYETVKKIAEGGEGMIYLVKKDGKPFAEKRIKTNDFNEMNSLFSEYSNLFTLKHENIFKIYEIFQDSNEITGFTLVRVIMELYDGDLLDFIGKFEMTEKLIIQIGIQVLNGLKYLHSNGIIHGDLKLENIFYSNNQNEYSFKIGDFGIKNTKKYEFYGSMLSIAPELIVNEGQEHDEKSDIFSFGGMLLRMMNSSDRVLYISSLRRNIHFDHEMKFSQSFKDLVINLLSPDPKERLNIEDILNRLNLLINS